jgi:hypothetical protein
MFESVGDILFRREVSFASEERKKGELRTVPEGKLSAVA